MRPITRYLVEPYRAYLVGGCILAALGYHYLFDGAYLVRADAALLGAALLGSISPLLKALEALRRRSVTIEVFNLFALIVSFATGEYESATFIALMLTIASWLDWYTEARASHAVDELLKLKPAKAVRVVGDTKEVITPDQIRAGDVLLVVTGEQIPADGTVVYGTSYVNEASLTGESIPIERTVGDPVYASTIATSGALKVRATTAGMDSTLERMAALIRDASLHKSRGERLADRFARIFMPIVLVGGLLTYLASGDIRMTAALFLVVCADDIAVSIPLAITAALGHAAKQGVIVKGGVWLHSLARVRTIAFDKTGTLTKGTPVLTQSFLAPNVDEGTFWRYVAIAQKFSEHPVGKALYREALSHTDSQGVPDPDTIEVVQGGGIVARSETHTIAIGNRNIAALTDMHLTQSIEGCLTAYERTACTAVAVYMDGYAVGALAVTDVPREDAPDALAKLAAMGIRTIMLTGDNPEVAHAVANKLGIHDVHAHLSPESKLAAVTELARKGTLAMVGDGINDAPALARADVGVAMGEGGTAVAVETADVVILTDKLTRIPDLIALARRTVSVVNADMGIWFVTNALGIVFVLTGVFTPAYAALYNLGTDFLPLLNSLRLFAPRRNL